ncbi:MAG: hypothetical protein KDA32_04000 [Phycisphaerales bacterium]|nr:hypothetical protein [Phycisphaerales bacterium]
MKFRIVACLALTSTLAGCQSTTPRARFQAPADARAAVARVNGNLRKIDGPIQARDAIATFRYSNSTGQRIGFVAYPAAIQFQPPQTLIFEIRSPLGPPIAEVGSNDTEYWVWTDVPDLRKLWIGTWSAQRGGRAKTLPLPPDQLLDALLLREMPVQVEGGIPPVLVEESGGVMGGGPRKRLVYQAMDPRGWPYVAREARLSPKSPYLPEELIEYDRNGEVVMRAQFSGYAPLDGASGDPAWICRSLVVEWPRDKAELRLDLGTVKLRKREVIAETPQRWGGEIEPLDLPVGIEPDRESRVTPQ